MNEQDSKQKKKQFQATWQSADADCRNQLGGEGHLVAIETQDEWGFLTVALENYGFGRFSSFLNHKFQN